MIKLETKNLAPSAAATIEIRSAGEGASVMLGTADNGGFVEDQWVDSIRGTRRQTLTFIGADGQPCMLDGPVDEADAVEMAAAYKAVVQVKVSNGLLAAKAIGRTSKQYSRIDIVRVVEVWDSPNRCLWKADKTVHGGSSMDSTGKITKAA
jgi:hypothetical protein